MLPLDKQVKQFVAARRVIPWPLLCPLGPPPAALVDQLKSVNEGRTLQTFMLLPKIRNILPSVIISRLRDTYELKNVRFSVVSIRRTRMLVSVSYCKETSPPLNEAA